MVALALEERVVSTQVGGPGPADDGDLRDLPLDRLVMSVRLRNWANRWGLTTLGQLAGSEPREVHNRLGLGRITLDELRKLVEGLLGRPWEELAAGAPPRPGVADPALVRPLVTLPWDALRATIPESERGIHLHELALPKRVESWAERQAISTLGELAQRSSAEIVNNLGPVSGQKVFEAVSAVLARAEALRREPERSLADSWRALLDQQRERPREVMLLRSGLGGEVESQSSIASRQGVSHSNIAQIEARALSDLGRHRSWLARVRARLAAAMPGGAVALDELGQDPYFAEIAGRPEALDYLGARVLGGDVRVIEIDGRRYLARCEQRLVDDAYYLVRQRAERVPRPGPLSAYRALLQQFEASLGVALADVLFARLRAELHVEETMLGPRVVGLGSRRAEVLLATLRTASAPVRVADLGEAASARPEQVVSLGRGVIGLPRHMPDWVRWQTTLVPAAARLIEAHPPDRQWHAGELLARLRAEIEVPEWLTPWHLGSLLRRSGRVRALGRLCFASLRAPEGRGRVELRAELLRIVSARGRPISRAEIMRELRKITGVVDLSLRQCLGRPPYLRCDERLVGLIERDLPGGEAARKAAGEHLAALLGRLQRGLAVGALHAEVRRLSPEHARWTEPMFRSVLRGDARFACSASGAVGLSSWEDARVPSRGELMAQCLDDYGGRARLVVVRRRIVAVYGEAPTRNNLALTAARIGATLRGKWLERAAEALPVP